MSSRLPEFVDPWRAADLGKEFSARIAVDRLPRLVEAVYEPAGEIQLDLRFNRDEQGRACVQGIIQATLTLECQRCLGPVPLPLKAELSLALVQGQVEAEGLPEFYDPLLVEEPCIRLLDIVEDELLLSIPLIPNHPIGQCSAKYEQPDLSQLESQDEDEEKENPFAVLASLKDKSS